MAEKKEQLTQMLNTSTKTFQKVLMESTHAIKIARHTGMKIENHEMDAIMAQMSEKAVKKVQKRLNVLVDENRICERFEELEQLRKESEELNRKLGKPVGYHFIKPSRDVGLHISETSERILSAADAEIQKLKAELEAEEKELESRNAVFSELVAVVESQQKTLWQ
ncbi:unnamed protein product [Caenorhabditis sp. 36 PRJEB53466]|nr:unnamed protein product [Caenorhabditis sp. 36 PRJEB53466]